MAPRQGRASSISSTTIAFCASLALHALLMQLGIQQYLRSIPELGLTAQRLAAAELLEQPPDQVGGAGGGFSNHDVAGLSPMIAPRGDVEQAAISLDPPGLDGAGVDAAASALPADATASRALPADEREESPSEDGLRAGGPRPVPFGIASTAEVGPFQLGEHEGDAKSNDGSTAVDSAATTASADSPATNGTNETGTAAAPAPSPGGGPPGAPVPQGDSDSHGFSLDGELDFRPGATRAKFGRRHRLVYPRIGLAALVDAASLRDAALVLKVTIDSAGYVKDVQVVRSSGSQSLDQAFRTVAYQWWFEPGVDGRGNAPKQETGTITMRFQ